MRSQARCTALACGGQTVEAESSACVGKELGFFTAAYGASTPE